MFLFDKKKLFPGQISIRSSLGFLVSRSHHIIELCGRVPIWSFVFLHRFYTESPEAGIQAPAEKEWGVKVYESCWRCGWTHSHTLTRLHNFACKMRLLSKAPKHGPKLWFLPCTNKTTRIWIHWKPLKHKHVSLHLYRVPVRILVWVLLIPKFP